MYIYRTRLGTWKKGKKLSHEEVIYIYIYLKASKGEGKAHPKSDLTHEMEG